MSLYLFTIALKIWGMVVQRCHHEKESEGNAPSDPERNMKLEGIQTKFPNFS